VVLPEILAGLSDADEAQGRGSSGRGRRESTLERLGDQDLDRHASSCGLAAQPIEERRRKVDSNAHDAKRRTTRPSGQPLSLDFQMRSATTSAARSSDSGIQWL